MLALLGIEKNNHGEVVVPQCMSMDANVSVVLVDDDDDDDGMRRKMSG